MNTERCRFSQPVGQRGIVRFSRVPIGVDLSDFYDKIGRQLHCVNRNFSFCWLSVVTLSNVIKLTKAMKSGSKNLTSLEIMSPSEPSNGHAPLDGRLDTAKRSRINQYT